MVDAPGRTPGGATRSVTHTASKAAELFRAGSNPALPTKFRSNDEHKRRKSKNARGT